MQRSADGLLAPAAHVQRYGADEDDALDQVLVGNADADQVQPVGQRHDDERADHRIDDAADAAGGGHARDVAGRDRVQLKAHAGGGRRGIDAGGVQNPAQRGHAAHRSEHADQRALHVHAGKRSRLHVAAHAVDVAAGAGVPQNEIVDADDHHHDDDGPGDALVAGQHHGQRADQRGEERELEGKQRRRYGFEAVAHHVAALADFHHEDQRDGDDPDQQGQPVVFADGKQLRHEPVGQRVERVVGNRDGAARLGHQRQQPAEDEFARQRGHERRHADFSDDRALHQADQHAQRQHQQDHQRNRHLHGHQARRAGAEEAGPEAHREVDLADDQHQRHAHGHHRDVTRLVDQVRDVARCQEQALAEHDLAEDLKHDEDHGQGDVHRIVADVLSQHFDAFLGQCALCRFVLIHFTLPPYRLPDA